MFVSAIQRWSIYLETITPFLGESLASASVRYADVLWGFRDLGFSDCEYIIGIMGGLSIFATLVGGGWSNRGVS